MCPKINYTIQVLIRERVRELKTGRQRAIRDGKWIDRGREGLEYAGANTQTDRQTDRQTDTDTHMHT
jgi:hypothetical protein